MQFFRAAHLPSLLGRAGAQSMLMCVTLTLCRFLSTVHLPTGILQNRRQSASTLLKHVLLFISHFRYKKAIFISPAARLECGSKEDALEHCAAAGRRFCFGWCKRSMSWHLFFSDPKANFPGLLSSPVLLGMHPKPNPVANFRTGGRSKLAKTKERWMLVSLFQEFLFSDQVSLICLTSWRLLSRLGSSLSGQSRKASFLISVIMPIPALARKVEV